MDVWSELNGPKLHPFSSDKLPALFQTGLNPTTFSDKKLQSKFLDNLPNYFSNRVGPNILGVTFSDKKVQTKCSDKLPALFQPGLNPTFSDKKVQNKFLDNLPNYFSNRVEPNNILGVPFTDKKVQSECLDNLPK